MCYNDCNMNKKIVLILIITLFAFSFSVYQYILTFQSELVNAYTSSKPANGHSWEEMECTEGLCVTNNRVGIGTDNPTTKLDVSGSIKATGNINATGDICNGSGYCLSQINGLTQPTTPTTIPLVNATHTETDCTNAGGTIVATNGTYNQCKFSTNGCPTGWTQYLNWSATVATTCTSHCLIQGNYNSCTTGHHSSFSNTTIESCIYLDADYNSCYYATVDNYGCAATTSEIGCY